MLSQQLKEALRSIPQCIGVGYVDIDANRIVERAFAADCPDSAWTLLSNTKTIIEPQDVVDMEQWLGQSNEQAQNEQQFKEILIYGDDILLLFLRSTKGHALVFICKQNANLGMVYATARAAASTIFQSN